RSSRRRCLGSTTRKCWASCWATRRSRWPPCARSRCCSNGKTSLPLPLREEGGCDPLQLDGPFPPPPATRRGGAIGLLSLSAPESGRSERPAERLVPRLRRGHPHDLFLAVADVQVQMGEELDLRQRVGRVDAQVRVDPGHAVAR